MSRLIRFLAVVAPVLGGSMVLSVQGGGSGLNTVVIVNQASSNSCELGNYFCERRQVPPENLLRISWAGGNIAWTDTDFQTNLVQPLLEMLATRQLSNQIDYVVLSMDIPFQTTFGGTLNGTTSALFYGLKPDPIYGWAGLTNSYAKSEAPFRMAQPATALGYSFLATMLTADSLDQAKRFVDQGVLGDRTFPTQPVVLEQTSDLSRNIRYPEFDDAIFNVRLLAHSYATRTKSDAAPSPLPVLGYQTGLANFSLAPNTFVPGAIADSLSSYGGVIFGPNSQTPLFAFLAAGAAGSYGTVSEPFTDVVKFPSPDVYLYQARGFSLAESYYQSLKVPYLGLIVGDPLSAPFADSASGRWVGVASNALLRGTAPLAVRYSTPDPDHPLQQIDLFVDGKYSRTITNLVPRPGNVLTATVNGFPVTYAVPANATAGSVAAALSALLNAPAVTNLTKVSAIPHGDRIELRSLSSDLFGDGTFFVDWTATNSAGRYYRISYLAEPDLPQISVASRLPNGTFELHTDSMLGVPYVIEASTNLADWVPLAASSNGGQQDFVDTEARAFAQRFYRVAGSDRRPTLSLALSAGGKSAVVHAQSQTALPFVLQESSDLANWTTLATNVAGGSIDLRLPTCTGACSLFYRTMLLPQSLPPATLTVLDSVLTNGLLLKLSGAGRPFVLEVSTDLQQWTALYTNLQVGHALVAGSSSLGTADMLSTFLTASRPVFLDSIACGIRSFLVDGTFRTNSWLQLTLTKVTGMEVSIAVTNQSPDGTIASLTSALCDAVNAAPALQESDGVACEDFAVNVFGQATFHLRARSPGYAASRLQVALVGAPTLAPSPLGTVALDQNLSDLQPRNHLYVKTGAASVSASLALDTSALSDGFHELAAVAYEGTHVRTQSRITLPVQIQNSALRATLTSTDLFEVVSVQGTYHLSVAANTNAVSAIRVFSTGGELATINGQSNAVFAINGAVLGAGLHPFYALVQTLDGLTYRTEMRWARLIKGSNGTEPLRPAVMRP
jgi:uncharacterized protein (TIGR03790 family)